MADGLDPDGAQLEWLSTTGGPYPAEAAGGSSGSRPPGSRKGTVALTRTGAALVRKLPAELLLGPGHPEALTLGRHVNNEAVFPLKAASKIHCQFALRSFRLPGEESVHQALFLRDVSKNKTLVNGRPAFRPWHWLQHGDAIGLHADSSDPTSVLNFYKVAYRTLVKLPGRVRDPSPEPPPLRPEPAKPAPAQAPVPSRARGRGRGRGRGQVKRPLAGAREAGGSDGARETTGPPEAPFRQNAVGHVVQITYADMDPPATFKVKIVKYDVRHKWHKVDSEGHSLWDGESFTDEVDLNQMHEADHVVWFGTEEDSEAADPVRPAKKKARPK